MSILEYQLKKFTEETDERLKRQQEERDWLINYIARRLRHKYDIRFLVLGGGGVGKSETDLCLSEQIFKKIHKEPIPDNAEFVEKNVNFFARDLVKHVRETKKRGNPIIFDESGQEWHARQYMSEVNMILSKLMIGFRYKQIVSMFNVPVLDLIDKTARLLCNRKIDVHGHGDKFAIATVYRIHPSKFHGDPWYSTDGDLEIYRPSRDLRNLYFKKKKKTQDEIYLNFEKELYNKEREFQTLGVKDVIDIVKKDPKAFMKEGRGGILEYSTPLIMGHLDITKEKALAVKAVLAQAQQQISAYPETAEGEGT